MPTQDHYAKLGIQQNASTSEIRKSFLKRSLDTHPDKNPGCSDAEFINVSLCAEGIVVGRIDVDEGQNGV